MPLNDDDDDDDESNTFVSVRLVLYTHSCISLGELQLPSSTCFTETTATLTERQQSKRAKVVNLLK